MFSIFRPAIRACCLACVLCLVISRVPGEEAAKKADAPDKYPLSTELKVLERDLSNPDYRTVLATMIPTDLAAEWQRVATTDNYLAFSEQHGGQAQVLADPALRVAYDRRKRIADSFLAMIREAYAKRHMKPGFDNGSRLEQALRSALSHGKEIRSAAPIGLQAILPAGGAEHQWPRMRGPDGQGTALGNSKESFATFRPLMQM
jgi:hypothetical protein